MQRFLSGVTVISGSFNYKHLNNSKNEGFTKFCDWYEVQKHIEDTSSNEEEVEMYSIRQLSRKLSERYGAEGSDVRLSVVPGFQKLCFCKRRPIV